MTKKYVELFNDVKEIILIGAKYQEKKHISNKYNKAKEGTVGISFGGNCTCPDGQTYLVGDKKDRCGSLACEGGKAGKCRTDANSNGFAVTCGTPNSLISRINKGFASLSNIAESCITNKEFLRKSPSCIEYIKNHLMSDETRQWMDEETGYFGILSRWKQIKKVYHKFNDPEFWLEAPEDCGVLNGLS